MLVYIHTWNKATAFGKLCDESDGPGDTFFRSRNSDLTGISEVFHVHFDPDLLDLLPLASQAAHDTSVENNLSEDHL